MCKNKEIEYISFDEFVKNTGRAESTIEKRYKEIPGIIKTEDGFQVVSGTRYPCDLHCHKFKNSGDRRKRAHHLITHGAAIESVAPLIKVLTETEFYAFAEKALAVPEIKGLLMEAVNEHNRAVQKAKGERGVPLTTNVQFGYLKAPADAAQSGNPELTAGNRSRGTTD